MGKTSDEYYQIHCLPKVCPICGKKFIPAPEHRWQIGQWGSYNRYETVCSYSCMRKWEKDQEAQEKEHGNMAKNCPKYTQETLDHIYANLPDDEYRKVAKLYYELRFSQERVAEISGYSHKTIQSMLKEIRATIKGMDNIKFEK